MINEHAFWKRDIQRAADELVRYQQRARWPQSSYARFEKLLMTSFYATRRMIESEWVESSLANAYVAALSFPARSGGLRSGVHYNVEEKYDLSRPSREKLQLRSLCNQIIHSLLFTPAFHNKRLVALHVCSDKQQQCVYRLAIPELVRMLTKTARSRHHVLLRFAAAPNRYDEA